MQTSRARRVTATERFHREASRNRISPTLVILGIIGAGLLVAIGAIVFGGGDRPEAFRARFERGRQRAAVLESDGDRSGALAIYRRLLATVRDRPEYRAQAAQLRGLIATLERERSEEAAAVAELRDYLGRAAKAVPESAAALLIEGRQLLHRFERASLPILAEVKAETVRLAALIPKPPPSPSEFRAQVERECAVSRRTGDFAGAVRQWNEYLDRVKKAEWKARAKLYQDAVHRMARESAQAIRRKAARLRASGDPEGAEALLKKDRPRFEGTGGAEFLR